MCLSNKRWIPPHGHSTRPGLLQGLEVEIDAKAVVADCLTRGVLVNATSERVLRFVPPLIISQAEVDRVLETLSSIFNQRTMAEKDQPH